MYRLQTVMQQHPLAIETPPLFQRSSFPTPFTLHFQGRSLQGEMQSDQIITPIEALTSLFHLSYAGHTDPLFRQEGKQQEKALKRLLGPLYEIFWQAFLADEEEQMQRQFIEVKPDPEQVDEANNDAQFKRLTRHDLSFGRRVVYFDSVLFPNVYVGRIEAVHQAPLEELVISGVTADVVLLQADDHERIADLFFETYIRSSLPPDPGVYAWPGDLPAQTFQEPKRPGHLISFRMKLSNFTAIVIASSEDFEEKS